MHRWHVGSLRPDGPVLATGLSRYLAVALENFLRGDFRRVVEQFRVTQHGLDIFGDLGMVRIVLETSM